MKTVLFACVHNTGRSQMAEAFFNRLADSTKARAVSGGVEPAETMNPTVLEVMREVGIDLLSAGHHPKLVTPELMQRVDHAYSMG